MWDERDRKIDHPQRSTSDRIPKVSADSLTGTGDHQPTGRVTGSAPVVRADGTVYLPPGTLFNEKYAVIEVLGEGDISVVHKARHAVMKNIVVIKLVKGKYASNSRAVLRFQREGQAVSRLNHQNIVRTFEFGISREGQPFLATEFFEGKSLSALLKEHGTPPLAMALTIFIQATEALASAHGAGFVHRDLKPSNIFVLNLGTDQPKVKLVDFGLADVFDEEEDGQKKVTKGGKLFGNPLYMSPEQCLGKNLDDRTDIYSLGCVMYEGLTGVPPLSGGTGSQTLQKQVQENPRTFREVAPQRGDLALIEPVVFKCLAKEPGSRYQTMAQLLRALHEVVEAGNAATAGSVPVDNTEALAAEERERFKSMILRRVLIGALIAVALTPIIGIVLFKSSEVEVALKGPAEQASFAMDRGQYQEAKKQFESLLDQARHDNLKESIVRSLGDQAVLEHISADKTGEAKDDREIADITETGGGQLFLDAGVIQAIDALLAGDKSPEDLEKSLTEPVAKMVALTQGLAWSQQYAPAKEAMALLIDKLSRKLSTSSPLVVNLKLHYASMLLQKIINPATPLTPHERQDLAGEPKALLDSPLSLSSGSELWLARSNFALAQALAGNAEEAKKLSSDVATASASGGPAQENRGLVEARLGDIDTVLNDQKSAVPMYKSAYSRFLAEKKYPQAAYCISAFSRSCWWSGQLKEAYEFLTSELPKPETAAPEAALVRAELQARLSQLQLWIATVDPSIFKQFFADGVVVKKSNGELRHEAESLAFTSLLYTQTGRPSELWLSGPAVDTLTKTYSDGNKVGRAVPLLRVKLAVAERTNNTAAEGEARHNLGTALLSYSKASMAPAYTAYDHSQICLGKADPAQEARALWDESYKRATTGGASSIFWLDQWFADLAGNYIDNDAVKVLLLTACDKSCDNVAETYGENSLEYVSQLRWQGRLAQRLERAADAQKSLLAARDIVLANAELPVPERINVFADLITVCQGMGDAAGVKKYTAESRSLVKH